MLVSVILNLTLTLNDATGSKYRLEPAKPVYVFGISEISIVGDIVILLFNDTIITAGILLLTKCKFKF